jgi:hypothetical protein
LDHQREQRSICGRAESFADTLSALTVSPLDPRDVAIAEPQKTVPGHVNEIDAALLEGVAESSPNRRCEHG